MRRYRLNLGQYIYNGAYLEKHKEGYWVRHADAEARDAERLAEIDRLRSLLSEIQATADDAKTDGGTVARSALFAISGKCFSELTAWREEG